MKVAPIKTAWINSDGMRLDAGYHLSLGQIAQVAIAKCPTGTKTVGQVANRIFYGGRARRYYVTSPENGIPFISSSGMLKADLAVAKLVSTKHTRGLAATLLTEKGWTLISRSGTIGNTAYVTEDFINKAATEDIIRVVPGEEVLRGYLFAFLSSRYGYGLLTRGSFGAVIQHIEPDFIATLLLPQLPEAQMLDAHKKIEQASRLREEATRCLTKANEKLMQACELTKLTPDDYEYFGVHTSTRPTSTFNVKKVEATTLAAFNYSQRIARLRARVAENVKTVPLAECLEGGRFFSTGSFKRLELDSPHSIELINQSDIFDNRIKGKRLARKYAGSQRLVDYGEVLIAGVGTLGENETFCRALFAGEELRGKLISGEFIRMNTNGTVPPGYLYAWLASDYGFRLIRATQAGTKLCRPIPKLLLDVPVPVLSADQMNEIHQLVTTAHTKRYEALQLETQAIELVESAIAAWQ